MCYMNCPFETYIRKTNDCRCALPKGKQCPMDMEDDHEDPEIFNNCDDDYEDNRKRLW